MEPSYSTRTQHLLYDAMGDGLGSCSSAAWSACAFEYLRMFSQDVIRYHPVLYSAQTESLSKQQKEEINTLLKFLSHNRAARLVWPLAAVGISCSIRAQRQSRISSPCVILALVCQLLWVARSPYQQQNLIWTNRVNLQLAGC